MILVIRPEPGCAATLAAGRHAGLALELEGCPLSEIRPLAWEPPPAESFDALLLGSANALRHAGPALANYQGKPSLAVGATTAEAAREFGLAIIATGSGGLQVLLDALAASGRLPPRLLRITGAEHVALQPPPGSSIETQIAYESAPLLLPPALAARLAQGGGVLLHSAAAARRLAAECRRLAVPRAQVALAALGPRIAAAAGEGWRRVLVAAEPSEAALLALAAHLCHGRDEANV